jgi:hypothetical protein
METTVQLAALYRIIDIDVAAGVRYVEEAFFNRT